MLNLHLQYHGVSRSERRKRAKEALEKVGLGNQLNKKPNQMSGGQMQRVAIARALVGNPDILLADEPTGALDSATSIQIMDLLKEIAKDRLVIMVTHNPELAKEYSTRIIRLLDGNVVDDSNPYKGEEENYTEKKIKKTSMSFLTALSLSLNNLMTKKGRTFLTSFAGSIGIIGIATIMSLSNGVQNYISKVQEDTLSSYPIMLEEKTINMADMITAMSGIAEEEKEQKDGVISSRAVVNSMLSMMSAQTNTNNLGEFKKFIESKESSLLNYSNAIQYTYNLNLNIYNNKANSDSYVQVCPNQIMNNLGMGNMNSSFGYSMTSNEIWTEMLDNQELMSSQYDVIAGVWPKEYNEVVLIVDEDNEISDYTLYSLGLLDPDDLTKKYKALLNGEKVEELEEKEYSYEELLNLTFKLVLNTDYYVKAGNTWKDMSDDEEFMNNLLNNSPDIKVVRNYKTKRRECWGSSYKWNRI